MKPKIKHPKVTLSQRAEIKRLAELVGQFIEYWGFKAVQGRMWCYLYLLRQPLSSVQLAQVLEISPALVTQSVQILLEYRVIVEAPKGPNGVLRFEANPDVAEAIREVLSRRESKMLEAIQEAHGRLEPSVNLDAERLEQVGQWVVLARMLLGSGVDLLRGPGNPFEAPDDFQERFVGR